MPFCNKYMSTICVCTHTDINTSVYILFFLAIYDKCSDFYIQWFKCHVLHLVYNYYVKIIRWTFSHILMPYLGTYWRQPNGFLLSPWMNWAPHWVLVCLVCHCVALLDRMKSECGGPSSTLSSGTPLVQQGWKDRPPTMVLLIGGDPSDLETMSIVAPVLEWSAWSIL